MSILLIVIIIIIIVIIFFIYKKKDNIEPFEEVENELQIKPLKKVKVYPIDDRQVLARIRNMVNKNTNFNIQNLSKICRVPENNKKEDFDEIYDDILNDIESDLQNLNRSIKLKNRQILMASETSSESVIYANVDINGLCYQLKIHVTFSSPDDIDEDLEYNFDIIDVRNTSCPIDKHKQEVDKIMNPFTSIETAREYAKNEIEARKRDGALIDRNDFEDEKRLVESVFGKSTLLS